MKLFNKAGLVFTALMSLGYAAVSFAYDYKESKPKLVQKAESLAGTVFANSDGLTLYTFSKDDVGASSCYDSCAVNWPPFAAKKHAKEWGKFTVIERKDGTYQWAYDNQPLYTWVGDQKLGDTTGEGVGNVWFALKAN